MAEKAKKKIEPNIQFVGKQRKYNPDKDRFEDVPRDAPEFVMDGGEKLELPDGIEKGAYVEPSIAARLFVLYPNDFKTPTIKGDKQ